MKEELSLEAAAYLEDLRRMTVEEIGARRVLEDQAKRTENAKKITSKWRERDGARR